MSVEKRVLFYHRAEDLANHPQSLVQAMGTPMDTETIWANTKASASDSMDIEPREAAAVSALPPPCPLRPCVRVRSASASESAPCPRLLRLRLRVRSVSVSASVTRVGGAGDSDRRHQH